MPRVVSSYDSIRQTLDYRQFDVCETLLRDLLNNPELSDPSTRDLLKEILASVLARRSIDHSRNFVARGNLDAARRVLHKAWHQLDNEGLEDYAEDAKRGIAAVASASERSDFDANHLSEIVDEHLGEDHFGSLVADLPVDGETATVGGDRPTRMVSKSVAKQARNTDGLVVVDPSQASIGQLIFKSMLRPRVILSALIVFILVMGLGLFTRTASYSTSFALLRPTNTGDSFYDVKVPALPKQTLQRLPLQPEVLGPVSEELMAMTSNESSKAMLGQDELKKALSASVASSDFGQSPLTLQLNLTLPEETLAEEGGQILLEQIVDVHNSIVNHDLLKAVEQKRQRIAKMEGDLDRLRERLRKESEGKMITAGDQKQRIDALLRLHTEVSKGLYAAEAGAAASSERAKMIENSRGEMDENVDWTTVSNSNVNSYVLQPLYIELVAERQKAAKMKAEIERKKYGPKHPLVLDLQVVEENIAKQEAFIEKEKNTMTDAERSTVTTRPNSAYDAVNVETEIARAEKVAQEKAKEQWTLALSRVEQQLSDLTSSDSEIPEILEEIKEQSEKQAEMRASLFDLEAFAERKPGGLQVISAPSSPKLTKSSPIQIAFAAIGLALLVAIVASFTGGHRAVHVVVLGLLATLFHVR